MDKQTQVEGKINRRKFLASAGSVALTAAGTGVFANAEESTEDEEWPELWMKRDWTQANVSKKHLVFVIDLRKCVGCNSCTVSCKSENNVPLGIFRAWVNEMEDGKFPEPKRHFLPRLCNHCENPPCVAACPAHAPFKRPDGAVVVDYDICVGWKQCISACPYDAMFWNPLRETAGKCTYCVHRIDQDLEPACVTTCIGEARYIGDLSDSTSEVFQLLKSQKGNLYRLKPQSGAKPQTIYILPEGTPDRVVRAWNLVHYS